jgi:hypothetical protein
VGVIVLLLKKNHRPLLFVHTTVLRWLIMCVVLAPVMDLPLRSFRHRGGWRGARRGARASRRTRVGHAMMLNSSTMRNAPVMIVIVSATTTIIIITIIMIILIIITIIIILVIVVVVVVTSTLDHAVVVRRRPILMCAVLVMHAPLRCIAMSFGCECVCAVNLLIHDCHERA